jgi:hypothetical protein
MRSQSLLQKTQRAVDQLTLNSSAFDEEQCIAQSPMCISHRILFEKVSYVFSPVLTSHEALEHFQPYPCVHVHRVTGQIEQHCVLWDWSFDFRHFRLKAQTNELQ